jgi:hypothetical protein
VKPKFLTQCAIAFFSANLALAAAAMPRFIGDRIVDKIMDWGDQHIHGPFKKGGGDEEAARQVISDIVMPVKAWRAVIDITTQAVSNTASAVQDAPGYSQQQGVPMPAWSQKQTSVGQAVPSHLRLLNRLLQSTRRFTR